MPAPSSWSRRRISAWLRSRPTTRTPSRATTTRQEHHEDGHAVTVRQASRRFVPSPGVDGVDADLVRAGADRVGRREAVARAVARVGRAHVGPLAVGGEDPAHGVDVHVHLHGVGGVGVDRPTAHGDQAERGADLVDPAEGLAADEHHARRQDPVLAGPDVDAVRGHLVPAGRSGDHRVEPVHRAVPGVRRGDVGAGAVGSDRGAGGVDVDVHIGGVRGCRDRGPSRRPGPSRGPPA